MYPLISPIVVPIKIMLIYYYQEIPVLGAKVILATTEIFSLISPILEKKLEVLR
jgi:hypothetical protein